MADTQSIFISTSGGGSGTVTNVSSSNTALATIATGTTTPVITIVAAPKLQTARNINGIAFDGSANINTGYTRTAVQTSNYSANPFDLVVCDLTSGSLNVTLPNAPVTRTAIAIKVILGGLPTNSNTVTALCTGSDVFNRSGGLTTFSLTLNSQSVVFLYDPATAIWTVSEGYISAGSVILSGAAAGGSLAGTYPNPTIASSVAIPGSPTTTTQATSDNSTKVATTAYVTTAVANAVAGVNPAVAVQYATALASETSGLTYNNGVSGVGATMTGVNNTVTTIDGHAVVIGDVGKRFLFKNDTQSPSGAFNGVYTFTSLHTSITGDIFTRALDYDQPSDINNTGSIPVTSGTANASTSWILTSQVTTMGTDPLTYTSFTINPSTILTNALPSAKIFVGNGSNIATGTSMTGNVTISNTGVTSIGASQVTNAMLAGSIAASNLIGTDITTIGIVTAGTWKANTIDSTYLNIGIASITTASSAINTSETVIVSSPALAANRLVVGTMMTATIIGTCTPTGTNASTIALRLGTTGTTSDAIIATATTANSSSSGSSIGFKIAYELTVRTVGNSATAIAYCTVTNNGTTGIITTSANVIKATMSSFDTTLANQILSITYKTGGVTTTSIFDQAIIEFIYK